MKKIKKHRISCIVLLVALMLCLISGIGARSVMTDGGKVEVKDVRIETDYGVLSGLIYKPKAAATDNKLPMVVASPGALNSREMQDLNLVELSRRGIVVLAIDMYAHGHSDTANSVRYITDEEGRYLSVNEDKGTFVDSAEEATGFTANGMIEAVEYVWNELGYVDHAKIGVTGHSVGARNVQNVLKYYSYQEKYGDGINKVSAGLLAAGRNNMVISDYDAANVALLTADYDEFIIEMVPPEETTAEYMRNQATMFMAAHTGDQSLLETGYDMGTLMRNEDGLLRVWYSLPVNHPMLHFSNQAAADTVEFFETSWDLDSGVPNDSFVWGLKEFFNFLGLVGFFLLLVPFVSLMLESTIFSSLKRNVVGEDNQISVPAMEKPTGRGQYVIYFGTLLLLTILPGLTYFTFMDLGATLIPFNAVLSMQTVTSIALWAMLNGVLAILIIFAVYFVYNRRKGVTYEQMGLYMGGGSVQKTLLLIVKTVVLALLTIAACYLLLGVCDYFFKTDFRIHTFAIKTFGPDKLVMALCYFIFFLIWSFGNNLAINSNFRKGMGEVRPMALSIISNILGVAVVLVLYYASYAINGAPMFNESIYPILLYVFLPLLAIAAVFARLIYRKTGNIYLGTLINAAMLCIITVTNTTIHFGGGVWP